MDLQGQPIPSGQRGVKNTSDPLANNPISEPSGPVVKDSLAAESANSGGAYSENRGAQPLGVSSKSTTTNTSDTSAARELPSTASARDRQNLESEKKYPDALGGQADYPGAHIPETGYVGGSTAAKKDLGITGQHEYPASEKLSSQNQSQPQSKSSGASKTPASGSGYQTRSATAAQKSQTYSAAAGQGKTDSNANQGDFPSDSKYNASFNSEIGSDQDPGRLAEQKFQRREAETVAAAAAPAQKGTGDGTWFTPLNADQRA
ncbi:hypothetical protein BJY04DRAFT_193799 [Aspergillus karnatakaensis]|uniref:uncharacterized protein n=1 Tax=Aspergillus karnatakaensis TaxID=1810916 RepID=UPI003CCCC18F